MFSGLCICTILGSAGARAFTPLTLAHQIAQSRPALPAATGRDCVLIYDGFNVYPDSEAVAIALSARVDRDPTKPLWVPDDKGRDLIKERFQKTNQSRLFDFWKLHRERSEKSFQSSVGQFEDTLLELARAMASVQTADRLLSSQVLPNQTLLNGVLSCIEESDVAKLTYGEVLSLFSEPSDSSRFSKNVQRILGAFRPFALAAGKSSSLLASPGSQFADRLRKEQLAAFEGDAPERVLVTMTLREQYLHVKLAAFGSRGELLTQASDTWEVMPAEEPRGTLKEIADRLSERKAWTLSPPSLQFLRQGLLPTALLDELKQNPANAFIASRALVESLARELGCPVLLTANDQLERLLLLYFMKEDSLPWGHFFDIIGGSPFGLEAKWHQNKLILLPKGFASAKTEGINKTWLAQFLVSSAVTRIITGSDFAKNARFEHLLDLRGSLVSVYLRIMCDKDNELGVGPVTFDGFRVPRRTFSIIAPLLSSESGSALYDNVSSELALVQWSSSTSLWSIHPTVTFSDLKRLVLGGKAVKVRTSSQLEMGLLPDPQAGDFVRKFGILRPETVERALAIERETDRAISAETLLRKHRWRPVKLPILTAEVLTSDHRVLMTLSEFDRSRPVFFEYVRFDDLPDSWQTAFGGMN